MTRFPAPRQLVGYLGLDPRVRQSGEKKARHGHISREGQAHARGLLVEAAHTAIRTPGPLRAFHARLAPRRGKQVALCATARKLTVLVWHLLTKNEDYAFAAPTITQRKLRALQRNAGDTGPRISLAGETKRKALEHRYLEEAERNYQKYVAFKGAARRGCRQRGHDSNGRQSGRRCAAGSTVPRRLLFSFGVTRARENSFTQPLTFSSVCAACRASAGGRGYAASIWAPSCTRSAQGGKPAGRSRCSRQNRSRAPRTEMRLSAPATAACWLRVSGSHGGLVAALRDDKQPDPRSGLCHDRWAAKNAAIRRRASRVDGS